MPEHHFPIGINAESIPGSRQVVALPSLNPSVGGTLEVVGLAEQGILLVLSDPLGAVVWSALLEGEHA
jgi:hypothetical protein